MSSHNFIGDCSAHNHWCVEERRYFYKKGAGEFYRRVAEGKVCCSAALIGVLYCLSWSAVVVVTCYQGIFNLNIGGVPSYIRSTSASGVHGGDIIVF